MNERRITSSKTATFTTAGLPFFSFVVVSFSVIFHVLIRIALVAIIPSLLSSSTHLPSRVENHILGWWVLLAEARPGNCIAGGSGYGLSFDWTRSDTVGLHWKNVPRDRQTVEFWYRNTDIHLDYHSVLSYSAYNVNGRGDGGAHDIDDGGLENRNYVSGAYESPNELQFALLPQLLRLWWGGTNVDLEQSINPKAASYTSDWIHYAYTVDRTIGEVAFYLNGEMLDFAHVSVSVPAAANTSSAASFATTGEEGNFTSSSSTPFVDFTVKPFSSRWNVADDDDALSYYGSYTKKVVSLDVLSNGCIAFDDFPMGSPSLSSKEDYVEADGFSEQVPPSTNKEAVVGKVALVPFVIGEEAAHDAGGAGTSLTKCSEYLRASAAAEMGAWAVIFQGRNLDSKVKGGDIGGDDGDSDDDGDVETVETLDNVEIGHVGGGGVRINAINSTAATHDSNGKVTGTLRDTSFERLGIPVITLSQKDFASIQRAGSVTFIRTRQFQAGENTLPRIEPNGVLHLGQEPDRQWADFDEMQSATGILDELRVWNVVRTSNEINTNYKRDIDVNSDPAAAALLNIYWKFDDNPLNPWSNLAPAIAKDSSRREIGGGSNIAEWDRDDDDISSNDGLVGKLPTIENQLVYTTKRGKTSPTSPVRISTLSSPLVGDGDVVVPVVSGSYTVFPLKSHDPDGDDLKTIILSLPRVGSLHAVVEKDVVGTGGGGSNSTAAAVVAVEMASSLAAYQVVNDPVRSENKRLAYHAPAEFDGGRGGITFRYSVDDGSDHPRLATVRFVTYSIDPPVSATVTVMEDQLSYFALSRPSQFSQKNFMVEITEIPKHGKLYQAQFYPGSYETYSSLATEVDQYGSMTPIDVVNTLVDNDRGIVLYKPNDDEFSSPSSHNAVFDSFEYRFLDQRHSASSSIGGGGELRSETAVLSVIVQAVNDAPVSRRMNVTVPTSSGFSGKVIAVESHDVDGGGATESFSSSSRMYAQITSFPRVGRLYQYDDQSSTQVDPRGNLMDGKISKVIEPQTFAWASRVLRFSSQFSQCGQACFAWKNPNCNSKDVDSGGSLDGTCSDTSYHASHILGEPDVWPSYVNSKSGWNPGWANRGHEWIELEFPFKVFISSFELYETFNAGAVYRISTAEVYEDDPDKPCRNHNITMAAVSLPLCEQKTHWKTLWTKPREHLTANQDVATVFKPPLCPSVVPTKLIRIDLDTSKVQGWNNFEAAKITGSFLPPSGVLRDSKNRFVYEPLDGVHGQDNIRFRVSDCLDFGIEERIDITIVPPSSHDDGNGSFSESVFHSMDVVLNATKGEVVSHQLDLTVALAKIETHVGEEEEKEVVVVSPSIWHSTALGANVRDEFPLVNSTDPFLPIHLGTTFRGSGAKVELWLEDGDHNLTFRMDVSISVYIPCGNGHVSEDGGICICDSARWTGDDCTAEVPENMNPIPPSMKIVCLAMFGIVAFLLLISLFIILCNRTTYQVCAAQPEFLYLVVFGCFLSSSTILALVIEGSHVACAITPWLYSIGFCFTFGSLFAKSLRVYRIFANGSAFRKKKVTVRDFLSIIFGLIFINVAILTLWTLLDPLHWMRKINHTDVYGYVLSSHGMCMSKRGATPYVSSLAVVHGLLLLFASVLCYRSRGIPTRFSEGKYVALTIASNLEVCLLGIPVLLLVIDDPKTSVFVRSTIIFLNTMAVIVFIFGNLAHSIYFRILTDGDFMRNSLHQSRAGRWSAFSSHGGPHASDPFSNAGSNDRGGEGGVISSATARGYTGRDFGALLSSFTSDIPRSSTYSAAEISTTIGGAAPVTNAAAEASSADNNSEKK